MPNVVGIRFESSGRVSYFDPADLELSVGERVVVDTEEGQREGEVVISPAQVLFSELRGPLIPVLRKADGG